MTEPKRDWSTQRGAEALAVQIAAYWAGRGRKVDVAVYEYADRCYAVRSNMVNGTPQPKGARS